MKKILAVALIASSFSFAQIKAQAQVGVLGSGIGVGLGTKIIPILLDAGIEAQTAALPTIEDKGKTKINGISVPYKGKYSYSGTNLGAYLQFHIPVINFIPVVNIFANPILHIGSIDGKLSVEGTVSALGQSGIVADSTAVKGSYVRIGLPFYLGPIFIEPSFGSQKLAVEKVGQYNIPDAQIALGLQFF